MIIFTPLACISILIGLLLGLIITYYILNLNKNNMFNICPIKYETSIQFSALPTIECLQNNLYNNNTFTTYNKFKKCLFNYNKLHKTKITLRIIQEDGQDLIVTSDYIYNRLNISTIHIGKKKYVSEIISFN